MKHKQCRRAYINGQSKEIRDENNPQREIRGTVFVKQNQVLRREEKIKTGEMKLKQRGEITVRTLQEMKRGGEEKLIDR